MVTNIGDAYMLKLMTTLSFIPFFRRYSCLSKYFSKQTHADIIHMWIWYSKFLPALDHELVLPTGKRACISKCSKLSDQFLS